MAQLELTGAAMGYAVFKLHVGSRKSRDGMHAWHLTVSLLIALLVLASAQIVSADDFAGGIRGASLSQGGADATGDQSNSANKIAGTVKVPISAQQSVFICGFKLSQRTQINVYLQRIGENGIPDGKISGGRTWVIIHGRNGSAADLSSLAGAIAGRRPSDQVLVLDWEQGAADNFPCGLNGAVWIPYVADWADSILKSKGVRAEDVSLIGHSWGTYVAYYMAANWKALSGHGVKDIVALDPALRGDGVPYSSFNFGSVANYSWAFYGSDIFGSAALSTTANEAFALDYDGPASEIEKHWAPVQIFETLVRTGGNGHGLFSLDRLDGAAPGPWTRQSCLGGSALEPASTDGCKFAGIVRLARSATGKWDLDPRITYRIAINNKQSQLIEQNLF